jgi:nucleotide-binding universal stress UspA family protein
MKTILVPTDFSKNALHAAKYADMLAKNMNAKIVLVHVYILPSITEYQSPSDIQAFIFQARDLAEAQLLAFKENFIKSSLSDSADVDTRLEYGFVPEKIAELALELKADLILMGTKGASNIFDKWIGTVAEKVLNLAKCMVLVVPQNTPITMPSEILYAADYEKNEFQAADQVLSLAKYANAHVDIVHIHTDEELNIAHNLEKTNYLLKSSYKEENVMVKNLNRSDLIEGLETYINHKRPDILALAKENKSIFERIFSKSITAHFVHAANLPLLIVRK